MAKKPTQHRSRARYSPEYDLLLNRLIAARRAAGVTQAEVAARLRKPQSHVSKCEAKDREINIIDLLRWSQAVGLDFGELMQDFERDVKQLEAATNIGLSVRPPR